MEGIIVGFTIGWLITQFLHSGIAVHGIVVRIIFSLVYSSQFLGIALATYCMRNIAVYVMVFPLAIVATEFSPDKVWLPWKSLHPLTLQSLNEDGMVDLIVWPESSLSESWYEPSRTKSAIDFESSVTVQDFQRHLLPKYGTNCLLGVTMVDRTSIIKYGLEVPHLQRYNCGCLVSLPSEMDCHEKIQLVPMREGLPTWLRTDFIRNTVLPFFKLSAPLTQGRNYHLLSFSDQQGALHTIAAAVCYESWHPWLPQFRKDERVEAIVYVMYDGDFADHPELFQRQLLSVRMRAIETRTWNLVCSSWRGTAINDPRGRIVKQLPAIAGVLRTDQLESN